MTDLPHTSVSRSSMKQLLKRFGRDVAARMLYVTGVTRPRHYAVGKLTIATFHRVLPQEQIDEYVIPGLAVTPQDFAWCLSLFQRHFDCDTLACAHATAQTSARAGKPPMAITFDDGQIDNYLHAKPVLDRLGIKASFFVPVEAIEEGQPLWHDLLGHHAWQASRAAPERARELFGELGVEYRATRDAARELVESAKSLTPDERLRFCTRVCDAAGSGALPRWDGFMSWKQLRTLASEGHEIGSHSMSHEILPLCDDTQLAREVSRSREIIEQHLQMPVQSFCYPNGDADERTASAVKSGGYLRAVTTRWGLNGPDRSPWLLHRCDMDTAHARDRHGRLSGRRVLWRMSGLYPGLT